MNLLAATDWPLFFKGAGAVLMGVVLFIGSIYVILSAVFGRRMGYLVLATAFFAWMILFSGLWVFGFFSQGPTTKTNLGPRGTESHWQPVAGGYEVASQQFPEVAKYPGRPWQEPTPAQETSVDPVKTAVAVFLADEANIAAHKVYPTPVTARGGGTITVPENVTPFLPEQFTVEDVKFATAADGKTSLAAARVFYTGGGPEFTVFARHDSGNVPVYSWIFFAASILGFAIHVPFLDRAERKRKDILTGGTAPVWRGPA